MRQEDPPRNAPWKPVLEGQGPGSLNHDTGQPMLPSIITAAANEYRERSVPSSQDTPTLLVQEIDRASIIQFYP